MEKYFINLMILIPKTEHWNFYYITYPKKNLIYIFEGERKRAINR